MNHNIEFEGHDALTKKMRDKRQESYSKGCLYIFLLFLVFVNVLVNIYQRHQVETLESQVKFQHAMIVDLENNYIHKQAQK